MIDCAEELFISIMDNQSFVQVAESSTCAQYTFIASAYNSFDNYNLEQGDFVYIYLPEFDQSVQNRIYSINNAGNFAQRSGCYFINFVLFNF